MPLDAGDVIEVEVLSILSSRLVVEAKREMPHMLAALLSTHITTWTVGAQRDARLAHLFLHPHLHPLISSPTHWAHPLISSSIHLSLIAALPRSSTSHSSLAEVRGGDRLEGACRTAHL